MESVAGPASWALAWTAGLLFAGIVAILASDALPVGGWALAPPTALTLAGLFAVACGVWRDHVEVHRGGVVTRLLATLALGGFWLVAAAAAETGWSLLATVLAGVCLWCGGVVAGLRALGRARALAMAILLVSGTSVWVILVHLPQLLAAGLPDLDADGPRLGLAAVVGACAIILGVFADLLRGVAGYRSDHTVCGLGLVLAGVAAALLVTAGIPATEPLAAPLPGLLAATAGLVFAVAAIVGGAQLLGRAAEASRDGVLLLAVAVLAAVAGGLLANTGPGGHLLAVKALLGVVATLAGGLAGLLGTRPLLRRGRDRARALVASAQRRRARHRAA